MNMKNPFVKSMQEVVKINDEIKQLYCDSSGIDIIFETTEEFIKEITPPCFTPVNGKPYIKVNTLLYQWPSIRGIGGCSTVYVYTSYEGIEGYYDIRMYIDQEEEKAIYIGREVYGESKVQGKTSLYCRKNRWYGIVEKHCKKIIELCVEVEEENLGSDDIVKDHSFEIRACPSPTGNGWAYTPQIITFEFSGKISILKKGKGLIRLSNAPFDPLESIPIREVVDAYYYEWDGAFGVKKVDEMKDSEKYFPFYYGQKGIDYIQKVKNLDFD